MLSVTNLSKNFGPQILFEGVNFQLNAGNRYGIVGANGSGKSTLLKIMMGLEEPSSGDVGMPKIARVGVLEQDHFQYEHIPILHVVMMGHEELWEAMREKDALLANAHKSFDADHYQRLEDLIERFDGYGYESRAAEILEGLSVPTARHMEPLSVLSGGFKLRVLLAKTLAAQPDILLLDEPTNHLDIVSIGWLEQFLVGFKGIVAVVSHDHRFLDTVCNHIADVDYQRVTIYPGNYADFERQKGEHRERMELEISKRDREIADHKKFIDRFKAKASKARQAQSRVKRMEKIEITTLPTSSRQHPKFGLTCVRPSGRTVATVKGIWKAYDDNSVLEEVSFEVMRGDRIAVIGPNGIGKSTLLKVLVGETEADAGSVEWGYETYPGYFAQDHADIIGEERMSVMQWLWQFKQDGSIGLIRGKLAEVLFRGDDVEKPTSALSGGESARLVFSKLVLEQPNVLVLDEPTNHLDLEGIDALAKGLLDYDGTILLVSHDRWFVQRIATRIIEIGPRSVDDYRGTYEEFVRHKEEAAHLHVDKVREQAKVEQRQDKAAKREAKAKPEPKAGGPKQQPSGPTKKTNKKKGKGKGKGKG